MTTAYNINIMLLNIMLLNIMLLNIMLLNIMLLNIMLLNQLNDKDHKGYIVLLSSNCETATFLCNTECHYSKCSYADSHLVECVGALQIKSEYAGSKNDFGIQLDIGYSFEKVKMIKNGFPCDIRNGAITILRMPKAQMPSDIKFLPFPCCYYIQLVKIISLHTGLKNSMLLVSLKCIE